MDKVNLALSKSMDFIHIIPDEKKINCLMAAATIGTGYFLYRNYIFTHQLKEQRRMSSQCNRGFCTKKKQRTPKSFENRNIFQRIYHLGGLFDSLEDLDRILEVFWIPTIERGLSFRFDEIISKKSSVDWQYTEISRASRSQMEELAASVRHRSQLPIHILYLMNISRVFGHWNLDDILQLNDDVEYVHLSQGSILFTINELDDQVYIVLSGCIQMCLKDEEDGLYQPIKYVHAGDQIFSLMSIIDFMVGKEGVFRTVHTTAVADSVVMKIPMASIFKRLMPDNRSFANGLQRVLRIAYEVIFVASHRILGLTKELMKDIPRKPVRDLENIPVLQKPSPDIVAEAGQKLHASLGVSDDSLLDQCNVMVVPPGFVLFEVGQTETRYVVFVAEGELEVALRIPMHAELGAGPKEAVMFIGSGEIFGALAYLTDDARQFNVRTSKKAILVIIPVGTLTRMLEKNPLILLPLVNSIFGRLSTFARQMDFGIEWTYYESGHPIFKAGDNPVATYLVLSGRVRALLPDHDGNELGSIIAEYGKYDFIGLVEMWTKRPRTKTALAVRDTEIAKIPYDFLTYICRRYAKVTFQVLQYLTRRVVNNYQTTANSTYSLSLVNLVLDPFDDDGTRSTYAIFPTSPDVPVHYIAKEFERQYEAYGTIIIINSDFVKKRLGEDALTPGNYVGLSAYLSFIETKYAKIFYVADHTPTRWSLKCFHQADIIFITVNNDGSKKISDIENMILQGTSLARKELLICHKFQEGMKENRPRYTRLWLVHRPWINFHHHLLISSNYYGLDNKDIARLPSDRFGNHPDVARIVRWLTGHAVGLALGGGGAKGAAHIGFLKEFSKTLLPVDMICGVSIGSFIGALYAVHQDIDKVERIARKWFYQIANAKKFILDMTIPYVSLFKGDSVNGSLVEIFGDIQIEDLRIPFFTCTTDLSNNSIREHRSGSLWRFVRASMTLINYFPPICDPKDGHYLIDGGYTNLLPADMMRRLGMKYVLALDISSKPNHYRDTNYGDSLSGLNLLSHMTPVLSTVKVPSMFEIQSRLNWAQSVVYLNLVKRLEVIESAENSPSVLYLRLPVDFYATSEFKRFDNIRELGRSFGMNMLEGIQPGDTLEMVWYQLKKNREGYRFGVDSSSPNSSRRSSAEEGRWAYKKMTRNSTNQQGTTVLGLSPAVVELYGSQLHL